MADNVKVVEIDPVRDKLLELIRCADFHPCKGAVATIGSKFSAEFIEDIADHLIANGVTVTNKNVGGKIAIRFKDFEIRPTAFLDGHIDPTKFDVVKWYDHEPREAINLKTGKKEISTRTCYSVAHIYWNKKEPCWEFSSVGTRFLEDYKEGLCEFVREWLELIGEPKGEYQ